MKQSSHAVVHRWCMKPSKVNVAVLHRVIAFWGKSSVHRKYYFQEIIWDRLAEPEAEGGRSIIDWGCSVLEDSKNRWECWMQQHPCFLLFSWAFCPWQLPWLASFSLCCSCSPRVSQPHQLHVFMSILWHWNCLLWCSHHCTLPPLKKMWPFTGMIHGPFGLQNCAQEWEKQIVQEAKTRPGTILII